MRLVVLGGGPAGYVAALRAAQLGADVTLVEAREIGGTCLNRGCVPTKAMVAAAERLRAARNDAEFGVVTGAPRLDVAAMMAHKQASVEQLRGGVEHMLRQRKVEIVNGRGRLDGPGRVVVEAADGGSGDGGSRTVEGDAVILASGSEPMRLPVFEIGDPRVMTSDEILQVERVPESLLVVGGGVIGCEFASVFVEFGSRVTVVEMLDQLLPGEDKRTGATLLQAFRKAGIETHLRQKVEKVAGAGDELTVALADGSELRAAAVLVSVGRRPVSRDMGYEEAGVAIGPGGFVVADETLRTGAAGVFAAGDLAGPPLLAHWAYHEGAVAAENAVGGGDRAVDRSVVPNAVFSHPEVASFGLTEDKAKAESTQVSVANARFNGNSKAVLEGENDGFVRIVFRSEDRVVVGASLVGPHVTELVHEIALAAHAGLTIDAVMDTIHAHPTLSEAVGEAALGAGGRAMHSL